MRVRAQTASGDYTFGQGSANFLVNSPEMVAQLIKTRLGMNLGEWFLDVTDGTPWLTQVLGAHTQDTCDQAVRSRILGTPGVVKIVSYSSTVVGRSFSILASVMTQFGVVQIQQAF
jgi:hypothetical protein